MDFSLSEEQILFTDSLRKVLDDAYVIEKRVQLLQNDTSYDETLWQSYAELGFLSLPFAENWGGFAGNSIDLMLAQIEFARALALEPYIATVIFAGSALKLAANNEQQQQLLPRLIAGELKLATAFTEPQSRYDLSDVETRADAQDHDYRISGHKAVVLGGDCADIFIISARTSGATCSESGLSLFLVPRDTPGVTIRDYRLSDGRGAADIQLDNVTVAADALLSEENNAFVIIDHVNDIGTAALCAEAIGVMEKINTLTLDYLKTREQFGRPIGKFQVLQHRMVDMSTEYEQARSLTYLACMEADNSDVRSRHRAISAAKVQVGNGGRFIAQNAIQSHGGIGVTIEYALGHYVKRLSVIEALCGDVDHHLARYGKLMLDDD